MLLREVRSNKNERIKMQLANVLEKIGIAPKYSSAMSSMVKFLLVLAFIQLLASVLPAWPSPSGIPNYIPWHEILETISIVISMMVFAVGWNSRNKNLSGNVVLLASVFFSVGAIDFFHTVSYVGMPEFFSPNDAQKHLNYWLSARFIAAVVLLVVVIREWKPMVSQTTRFTVFGSLAFFTLVLHWAVTYHQGWFPDTFIPGQGLTQFKKNFEYMIIMINLVTAVILLNKMRKPQPFKIVMLFGAVCTLIMSEYFFTIYSTMLGSYNILGHIYKAIAYLLIYRAIVVEVIEEPYELLELAKEKFSTIFDSVNDGIEVISMDGHVVDMNSINYERLGYTKDCVIGKPISDFIPPGDPDRVSKIIEQNKIQGKLSFVSERMCKNGSLIPVEINSRLIELDGQQVCLGICRDITERNKAEVDFKRYKATIGTTHDGFWLTDANGVILEANQAYADMTGYTVDELVGMHISNFEAIEKSVEEIKAHVAKIVSQGWDVFETRHRHRDGHEFAVEVSATYFSETKQVVSFLRDITSRKEAEKQIEHLAFYDPLTHLPNRRLLQDRLQQTVATNVRNERNGAVLFIDLDNFKTLNDTLGHDVGDFLLQKVAERLTTCVREGDTVSRLGGDEFVVLLDGLSAVDIEAATQAEAIAQKIISTLNRPYQLDSRLYLNTPSIGATLFGKLKQGVDEILKQADIAMYQAKNSGRNTFRFFDIKMQEAINNRVEMEAALREAISHKQFKLYYQIQIDQLRRPVGAEALIRWIHPEKGMISPIQFIPLAEETGLILPIGQWVLDTACAQLKAWQGNAKTQHLTMSINVSAKQFHEATFVEQVNSAVRRYSINPELLKLEPTESILLQDIDDAVATMNELKLIGVRFALDDFGTGFSSLQYLKNLPLNQLKIDQSFVRDLVTDPNDRAIVRTIIAMAHSLNLETIAEGVETDDQRAILESEGCNLYQGYLFGRPVPIEEFDSSLG